MFLLAFGIIKAVFVLSLIIFVHELGHFLAARKSGIIVERFSLGFGPKLIGITRGETEYRISILPFGGYVKMSGENPQEQEGKPGEFSSAPVSHRIFVAITGPVMNFLLGIIAFYFLYLIGVEVPRSTQTTKIGYVADDSRAKVAGIQAGDRLISINDSKLNKWADITRRIFTSPEKEVQLTLIRDGEKVEIAVVPKKKVKRGLGEYGEIGIFPRTDVMVGEVSTDLADIKKGDIIKSINGQPIYYDEDLYEIADKNVGNEVELLLLRDGKEIEAKLEIDLQIEIAGVQADTAAEEAGLEPEDKILTINDQPIRHYSELEEVIKSSPDQVIFLGIQRGDERITLSLSPRIDDESGVPIAGFSYNKGTISGISFTEPSDIEKYNIILALGKGIERSFRTIAEVFGVIKDLLTRDISPRYLSGPVGIVSITVRVASGGIRGLLFITAFISINLGIINLLPIPIADGGQILFFLFEKVRGKPLSIKKQLIIQQVSIVLLILIFVYITRNDIVRLFVKAKI